MKADTTGFMGNVRVYIQSHRTQLLEVSQVFGLTLIMKGCIMFNVNKTLLALVLFLFMGWTVQSNADESLREDLQTALEEIRQLRYEINEMKEGSDWQYQSQMEEAFQEMPGVAKDGDGVLTLPAGWSIKPYGYIKSDIVYDDSYAGNVCFRAKPESGTDKQDDSISVTARQTRLGVDIYAPNIGDMKVMGKVETDFYGSGSENSASLRIRRAFGQLEGEDWFIRFGQDWEIISPLFPDTLNFAYGAMAGNPGFRYPHIRFDKWWVCNENGKFVVQLAAQREMASDIDGGGKDDGQDASFPSILGRVGYHQGAFQLGFSGHIGQEEVDWDLDNGVALPGNDVDVHSWSVNADLRMPLDELVKGLTFSTELFLAENYDGHAGTFEGISLDTVNGAINPIGVAGGWAQLQYRPDDHWKFVSGAGLVDPVNSDVLDGVMTINRYYWSNVWYYFSKYLATGIEISYFDTDYKNSANGTNLRYQHSWIFNF